MPYLGSLRNDLQKQIGIIDFYILNKIFYLKFIDSFLFMKIVWNNRLLLFIHMKYIFYFSINPYTWKLMTQV